MSSKIKKKNFCLKIMIDKYINGLNFFLFRKIEEKQDFMKKL